MAKTRLKDITGQTFGRLKVIEIAPKPWKNDAEWLCQCECGNVARVRGAYLRSGHTKSCGHCLSIKNCGAYCRATIKNGRSFIFDTEDLPFILRYSWSVTSQGYVLGAYKNKKPFKLHRLLLDNPDGVVDHINGNPSDCRKSNLRVATQHQNSFNSTLPKNSTTGYKGVCWDKKHNKYMAHIHPNGKMKFLGYFDNPIEAALAYDEAAFLYYGQYAKPNFKKEELNSEKFLELEESGGRRTRR